jgi:hypothetical protein
VGRVPLFGLWIKARGRSAPLGGPPSGRADNPAVARPLAVVAAVDEDGNELEKENICSLSKEGRNLFT